MSRWFRFYDCSVDDPKVQRLPDAAFRAWVNLLCIASKNGGRISNDYADIAFSLRLSSSKARDVIQVLISAKLIDQCQDGFEPHNWKERQYESDTSAARMRRHRGRHNQEDVTVNVTSHVTSRVTNSDGLEQNRTEQNRTEQNKTSLRDVCAEPHAAHAQVASPVANLPTNRDGKHFAVSQAHLIEFEEAYPAVDVRQELREIKAWLLANPTRRRTAKGMLRFVNSWLSKKQDEGNEQRSGRLGSAERQRRRPTAFDNFIAGGAQFLAESGDLETEKFEEGNLDGDSEAGGSLLPARLHARAR